MPDLISDSFSLLTCVSEKTKVQREHMDDLEIGASALWGLVENQYVIVWMHSYEMNLEIERIAEFYDDIVAMKPTDWSDEAFWNLVSTIHLRNQKFASEMRPRPVKIPLKVLIIWLSFCSPFTDKPPSLTSGGRPSPHGLLSHPLWHALRREIRISARASVLGAGRRPGRREGVGSNNFCVEHDAQVIPWLEIHFRGKKAV
jgi:hypothetical protein